jgi:hypothetical protein
LAKGFETVCTREFLLSVGIDKDAEVLAQRIVYFDRERFICAEK